MGDGFGGFFREFDSFLGRGLIAGFRTIWLAKVSQDLAEITLLVPRSGAVFDLGLGHGDDGHSLQVLLVGLPSGSRAACFEFIFFSPAWKDLQEFHQTTPKSQHSVGFFC